MPQCAPRLLEVWRVDQTLPAPDVFRELDLDGTGADSAAAAVEQVAEVVAPYDVDGLLVLLSPDEAAALYHYRDAVTAALDRDGALAELRSEGQLMIDSVDVVEGDEVGGPGAGDRALGVRRAGPPLRLLLLVAGRQLHQLVRERRLRRGLRG